MAVEIAHARRLALERVVEVIRTAFATELATIATAANLDYCPAPEPRHVLRTDPDTPEFLDRVNANVVCWVFPDQGRDFWTPRSEGPTSFKMDSDVRIDVVILFKAALVDMPTGEDSTKSIQSFEERMWRRAMVYSGALLHTVTKYAKDGASIHTILPVDDDAVPLFDEEQKPMWGLAYVSFGVKQILSVPNVTPLT